MSDTVLTQTQLENIFQSWTSTVLNTTDPSAVRISWPQDGAPVWGIDDDVCFIAVTPIDTVYSHQVQTDYSEYDANNANVNLTYSAGIRVGWTLYGPNAYDRAGVLWSQLFSNDAKDTFASSNLALILDVPQPIRTPELFNGQWFNRATLYANFNELVIRNSTVPYLQTPDVQVIEG